MQPNAKQTVGIIILAAGASARMGAPKQQLKWHDESLLDRMVKAAVGIKEAHVGVVLREGIAFGENQHPGLMILLNRIPEKGMSSSILCGMEGMLARFPELDSILITVCDQPFVTTAVLRKIIDVYNQSGSSIVASRYEQTVGTPALFKRSVFEELLKLEGDKGAKQIITKDSSRTSYVDFPMGEVDIDTKEDYDRLLKMNEYAR